MHIRKISLIWLALAAFTLPAPLLAQDIGDAERKRIETIVREYLIKNPEVLVEALTNYEQTRQAESMKQAEAAVLANRKALEEDPSSPLAGNVKGDVTVVEFFDYRCAYCKKVMPSVRELLKTDGDVRFIFKEFPILGPDSQKAAEAAQAAWKIDPGKYLAFHYALMDNRGTLDEGRIFEIAKSVGLDPAKLKTAMKDPAVQAKLKDNLDLAQKLRIGGTPAFIVGDRLMPGAVDLETLKAAIADARQKN